MLMCCVVSLGRWVGRELWASADVVLKGAQAVCLCKHNVERLGFMKYLMCYLDHLRGFFFERQSGHNLKFNRNVFKVTISS